MFSFWEQIELAFIFILYYYLQEYLTLKLQMKNAFWYFLNSLSHYFDYNQSKYKEALEFFSFMKKVSLHIYYPMQHISQKNQPPSKWKAFRAVWPNHYLQKMFVSDHSINHSDENIRENYFNLFKINTIEVFIPKS